jgi:hypothetical protein
MSDSPINLIGIAAWKFVPSEPRHNTFHQAISEEAARQGVPIHYLGLRNTYKADWATQILPDTVLKRVPYISPLQLFKILRSFRLTKDSRTVIYLFEGSFAWLFLLTLLSGLIPNSSVVCNLFPSSKYSKILLNKRGLRPMYTRIFLIISKFRNIHLTFDTQLMTSMINKSLGREQFQQIFPLPSALPYLEKRKTNPFNHHKVLINMRDFNLDELHELISQSCRECTFVLPRGPMASTPLIDKFGQYSNLAFDERNIPVEDYLVYIDQFDYMIFLYKPSIDSSGKLLDAVVRGIPVCLPAQSTEWCSIAAEHGYLHQYDYLSLGAAGSSFNHPIFSEPRSHEVPEFTPSGAIKNLSKYAAMKLPQKNFLQGLLYLISSLLITLHWIVASAANFGYSLRSQTESMLRKIR